MKTFKQWKEENSKQYWKLKHQEIFDAGQKTVLDHYEKIRKSKESDRQVRDLGKVARELGIEPLEVSDREMLLNCLNLLDKFGNDDRMYEVPRGTMGQDGYVGCPVGMREANEMVELIEWILAKKEK